MSMSGYSATVAAPPSLFGGATQSIPDDRYWTLEQCKQAYFDYLTGKIEEIREQQESRRYRHGSQWSSKQIEVFNKRKQPIITYNRIGRKIDSIVGLVDKFKQDPKAVGNTARDEAAAELANYAVRYVINGSLRDNMFPPIAGRCATDGYAGVEMLLVKGDKQDIDIAFAPVNIEDFFYDPTSVIDDFSDAGFMGLGKWYTVERAKDKWPEFADQLETVTQSGAEFSSNPDNERKWFTTTQHRTMLRIVEIWYKYRGGWCWALFTGAFKMMEGQSYFYDDKDNQICKFRMFSCAVDQDGDRYSFIRNLKGPQDEINQRRSKGLHELNSRRIKAEEGALNDVEQARVEAVRPDGVVLYNKDFEMEFDDATRLQNMEGNLKFLEEAKNEIENFGPNPALIGQGLEYKSGRAISLLQQAGIAELGSFIINYKNWRFDLYRNTWCAIKRYWTGERYIRVTDEQGIAYFVGINKLEADPQTGIPRMINQIGKLDVNIIMDEGQDEVNMMADAYDTLGAMATQGANVPPEILIELAPLQASVKRKLLAKLQPDPQELQKKQQVEAVQLQTLIAQLKEIVSRANLNDAKAQETAQGGAHGMLEREYDRRAGLQAEAIKQSGSAKLEDQKHQNKMTEMVTKDMGDHLQHRRKLRETASAQNGA